MKIAEYNLIEIIGRGAFSEVYRATLNGEPRAVKVMRPTAGAAAELLESARFEFWVLKDARHPNVVAVHDFGVTLEGAVYLVEEWLDGVSLGDFCRDRPFAGCEGVLRGVLEGLACLHGWNVVHGDIKPHNIIVVRSGEGFVPKILDFGLAKISRGEGSGPRAGGKEFQVSGTPETLAPEVILGGKPGPASDLYALGATFYEALTGTNPFAAADLAGTLDRHLRLAPKPPGLFRSDLPRRWEKLILDMLAKNPGERPDSAGQALTHAGGGRFILGHGPFVGREGEMRKCLESARASLTEGKPVAIAVSGPVGAGSSRFAHEFFYRLVLDDPSRRGDIVLSDREPYEIAKVLILDNLRAPASHSVVAVSLAPFTESEFRAWLSAVTGVSPVPDGFVSELRRLSRALPGPAWDILSALADLGILTDADGRVTSASLAETDFTAILPREISPGGGDFAAVAAFVRGRVAHRRIRRDDPAWEELARLARETGDRAERRKCVAIGDGLLGAAMIDWGDLETARERLSAALSAIEEENALKAETIRIRNYLGHTLLRRGRAEEAVAVYEKSDREMQRLTEAEAGGIANLELGAAYLECGRTSEAVVALKRELAFHERHGHVLPLLNRRYLMALARARAGDFASAAGDFEATAAAAREAHDPSVLLRALNGLGNARDREGNAGGAAVAYGEAKELALALSDMPAAAASAQNRGALFAKLGRYDEARADLEASLRYAEGLKHRYAFEKTLIARALTELGSLEMKRSRPDEARAPLEKAWGLAENDFELKGFRFWIVLARCRLWEALHDGPRFEAELSRLNFEAGDDAVKRAEVGNLRRETVPGQTAETAPAVSETALKAILRANRDLILETDRDALLRKILGYAVELAGAELGVILIAGKNGELTPALALNAELDSALGEVSLSVAQKALRDGRPVRVVDAKDDGEYNRYASVMALKLRSILGLPMVFQGKALGVLYLSHRFRAGLFDDKAIATAGAFADQAGLALKTFELLEFHRRAVASLGEELEDARVRLAVAEETSSRAEVFEIRVGKERFATRSERMRRALILARKLAGTSLPVLIHGETGSGKEVLARYIHEASPRKSRPFVAVNCGALPATLAEAELFGHAKGAFTGAERDRAGLLEAASGGTLFLDEIADLPLALQVKLLRVLQEKEVTRLGETRARPVDVRLAAASHRPVRELAVRGKFREDLYYRLAGAELGLPALRERSEDIPLLSERFLEDYRGRSGARKPAKISPRLLKLLAEYPWPGNIRELKNLVEAGAALCEGPVLTESCLPQYLAERLRGAVAGEKTGGIAFAGYDPRIGWKEIERQLFISALVAFDFDVTRSAASLGVGVATVYKKMREDDLRARAADYRDRLPPYEKGVTLSAVRKRVFSAAARRHPGHPYRAARELGVAPLTFTRHAGPARP